MHLRKPLRGSKTCSGASIQRYGRLNYRPLLSARPLFGEKIRKISIQQKFFSAATVQLGKWDSIRVDFIIWLSMIGLVILLSCIHYRYTTK